MDQEVESLPQDFISLFELFSGLEITEAITGILITLTWVLSYLFLLTVSLKAFKSKVTGSKEIYYGLLGFVLSSIFGGLLIYLTASVEGTVGFLVIDVASEIMAFLFIIYAVIGFKRLVNSVK